MNDGNEWFERVWEFREETLYPQLFGTKGDGRIHPLSSEFFKARFNQNQIDPRWTHHGVLVFPPSDRIASWQFVTSGLSNEWEADTPDSSSWSGIGVEFLVQAPHEAGWALDLALTVLAYQLLLAAGRFGENPSLIQPFHRIPLGVPIGGEGSRLTHIFVCRAPLAPQELQLESGRFSLLQLFGATDAEIQFAREHGGEQLLERLVQGTAFPVIDISRKSVVPESAR